MKKFFFFATFLLVFVNTHAQNVGIGTTTPATKLHVITNSGVNNPHLRLEENEVDFSRLGFLNAGSTKFWEIAGLSNDVDENSVLNFYNSNTGNLLSIRGSGNVGIGNALPQYPLSFSNALGSKVSFWNGGGSNFGIGIQTSLLQLYTAYVNDDVAFGYGSSSSFTETMRIKGNGNVGIGTSNPVTMLDINSTANIVSKFNSSSNNMYTIFSENNTTRGYIGSYSGAAEDFDLGTSTNNTTGKIHFTTQATPKMTIDNAGNVGIGTTSPSYKLDMSGRMRLQHSTNTAGIYFDGVTMPTRSFIGTYDDNHVGIYGSGGASWNFLMNVNNGNIGIGNTSPQFPLSFSNDMGGKISLWNGASTNFGIGIQTSLLQIYTANNNDDVAFGYGSSASFTETMRIKGNGNVGIGTTNPQFPLSFSNITGGKISFWSTGPNNNYGIGLQDYQLQIYAATSSDDIVFGHGSSSSLTETMRIKGNGNIGIGTSTPLTRFHISGNSVTGTQTLRLEENENDFSRIGFYNTGSAKYWETTAMSNDNDANSEFNIYNSNTGNLFTIKGDGKIGIGTTAPTTKLEVNGFTKLGSDAPAIKVKKYTGVMNATATQVAIPHGLNFSKILSVSVLVEYASGSVPSAYTVAAGYEYNYHVTETNVAITPATGNCANILSKNFKVLITYEE